MADLKHLDSAWDVDRNIVLQGEKLVLIRFSKFELMDHREAQQDPLIQKSYVDNAQMDENLVYIAPRVSKYCVVYAVDISLVGEFNQMYELGDDKEPFAIMFFFMGRHIKVDLGMGNNNKINFVMDTEDLIPIVEQAFVWGKRGKSICKSEKQFAFEAAQ